MAEPDYTLFGSGATPIPRPTDELFTPSLKELGITPMVKGPGVIDVSEHPSRRRGGGPGLGVTLGIFGAFLAVGVITFFILTWLCKKRRRKQEEQMQMAPPQIVKV